MTFVVAHRGSGVSAGRGHSMRRAGQRLTNTLRGWRIPTPQERADRYVSRTPLAVLAPSAGGDQQ
jgi:hypothetical protein